MTDTRIAISGKMHSGKTTCAEYLASRYGFTKVSVGEALYQICAQHSKKLWSFTSIIRELFPEASPDELVKIQCDISDIFHRIPVSEKKNRRLLQAVGQRMRTYDGKVWARHAFHRIETQGLSLAVIDDLRDPSEYEFLKDNGFEIWRINVSPEVQAQRAERLHGSADPFLLNHPSETGLDDAAFDFYLNSDLPLSEMCAQIDQRIKELIA